MSHEDEDMAKRVIVEAFDNEREERKICQKIKNIFDKEKSKLCSLLTRYRRIVVLHRGQELWLSRHPPDTKVHLRFLRIGKES